MSGQNKPVTALSTLPSRPRNAHFLVSPVALSILGMTIYLASLSGCGFSTSAVATVSVVGFAALLSSIGGFAFSAICGAMLFQFRHDIVLVVETMLICSIANQAMSVWLLRREISARKLAPFLLGGIAGVPTGVWVLLHLDPRSFKAVLGALLLTYGLYMLFRRPIILRQTSWAGDVVSGFVGGMAGGFAATPGAAVSIWCGMKGWDKARQRAVFQPFILVMQFVALGAIATMHEPAAFDISIPPSAWACVPAGLVGTWWGMAVFRRMTDSQFAKAINLLLIASGIGLVA